MRLVLISGFQGRLCSFLRGLGSSFSFTLAATHFTWVVRRAAVGQHDGSSFNHGRCFDRCRLDNNWRWLHDHFGLRFDNHGSLLGNHGFFHDYRRLLDFAGFNCWRFDWGFDRRFGNDHRFSGRGRFDDWLRRDFDHGLGAG